MRIVFAALVIVSTATAVLAKKRDLPSPSDRPDLKAVCAYATAIEPDKLGEHTLRSGVFDIDGDGSFETVLGTRADGTMGGDAFEIRDASGNLMEWSEADIGSGSELLSGARWLPFRGRAYLLGFSDEQAGYLVRLSYPDVDGTLRIGCRFEISIESMLLPMDSAHIDVCQAIGDGKVEEIKVTTTTDYRLVQDWTRVMGEVSVDLTGKVPATRLYELSYSSGAGSGCDATFFDTAASVDLKRWDATHQSLMDLQGIYFNDAIGRYSPPECGGLSRRWLRVNGATYLETRYPRQTPERLSQEVHRIDSMAEGRPRKVCEAMFTRSLSLSPEGQ